MLVVIGDGPPRLLVGRGMFAAPTCHMGDDCPYCDWAVQPLWGDGAALAVVYAACAHKPALAARAEAARLMLADWLIEHAAELDLPEATKVVVGAAVRDGTPDTVTAAKTKTPQEVA